MNTQYMQKSVIQIIGLYAVQMSEVMNAHLSIMIALRIMVKMVVCQIVVHQNLNY
ncbi:hypothetical protein SAMN05216582_1024 [Selenomonas ruminantium]|uniref:Uncharacterized protein n=1 Tax=Selenomonas ruminantium TaxID=971 RepID=A0A1M6RDI6_SELRU|nr:hypothetical protein SAMN05216582_1024 [Selenomonas ruminantium]